MDPYLSEWLNLIGRWVHVVTGIAWIGASFYFVWLDSHLTPPKDNTGPIGGELWSIHGGGFYHVHKFRVAPERLPETLHWFKWEAYSTWLSGFFLLCVLYYAGAEVYLIDKSVADISPTLGIIIGLAVLFGGWFVYDALCKSRWGQGWTFPALGLALLLLTAWGLTQVFSGRAAFLHVGALLGTLMAANVWRVIMPSQQELVAAVQEGRAPDAAFGIRAKQRSMHNNYMTLPVIFTMLSNHYPMTYGHAYNWLVLAALFVIGAAARHFFNLKHRGRLNPFWPAGAALGMIALALIMAPRAPAPVASAQAAVTSVSFVQVAAVIERRCQSCHSAQPRDPNFPVAPAGVMFDSVSQISQHASRIHERAVVSATMPLANLTQMTDEERALLGRWFAQGAGVE